MFLTLVSATDCDLLISLSRGLNLHLVNPTLMSQVETNCCTAPGIGCSGPNVTTISWTNKNMNGTINGTAVPPMLTVLSIQANPIYGDIPMMTNNIRNLYLYGSKLNGSIVAFPSKSNDIRIHDNQLTGSLPDYPTGLSLFYCYNNKLSGALPPMRAQNFYISNNFFTGPIPSLFNGFRMLRVDGNLLTGIMPPIPSSLIVLQINTANSYSNRISGVLHINSANEILIFNCNFTAITVVSNATLTQCDMSYNPIPEEYTINFPNCAKKGTGVNYRNYSELGNTVVLGPLSTLNDEFLETTLDSSLQITLESTVYNVSEFYETSVKSTSTLSKLPRATLKRLVASKTSSISMPMTLSPITLTTTTLIKSTNTNNLKTLNFLEIKVIDPFKITITLFTVFRVGINVVILIFIVHALILRCKSKRPRKTRQQSSQ